MAMQLLYGPPPSKQIDIQPAYGVPTPADMGLSVLSTLFSTTNIILSFFIGSILFLITQKKIFIIIPLIFANAYFVLKFLAIILGFNF